MMHDERMLKVPLVVGSGCHPTVTLVLGSLEMENMVYCTFGCLYIATYLAHHPGR